jgi:hypothetical protein
MPPDHQYIVRQRVANSREELYPISNYLIDVADSKVPVCASELVMVVFKTSILRVLSQFLTYLLILSEKRVRLDTEVSCSFFEFIVVGL